MHQPYLAQKSHILQLIKDQLEQIKYNNTVKLNNILPEIPNVTLSEVIECLHEFLHSHEPYLELERLSLQGNQLTKLPNNFSIISSSIRYLDLHDNKFTVFPEVIDDIPNLEILDMSKNMMYTLPSSHVARLQNLRVLSLKENRFKYLPPVLGKLGSLHLIEVTENPLVMPSPEVIRNFQMQSPDLDWVNELKNYLNTNSSILEMKLAEQADLFREQENVTRLPPAISRSKSISETRTSASRAARRMGLIIRKPEETKSNDTSNASNDSSDSQYHFGDLSGFAPGYSSPLPLPQQSLSASASQTAFSISTPPPAPSITTVSTNPGTQANAQYPQASSTPTMSRTSSRNRSRSNTLREIDRILEKSDTVDTEHKSGAYFRRLSTLQELPTDENISVNIASGNIVPHSSSTSRNNIVGQQYKSSISQSMNNLDTSETIHEVPQSASKSTLRVSSKTGSHKGDVSPSRTTFQLKDTSAKKSAYTAALIKASRKILFSFSELHSSVRRFTGFCIDKKITIKMVSYLYTTKSNIDSLVENLEIVEENGDNIDQINVHLHACISSFKSIMDLLSENFSTFVMKIDVCFIRMLYLTLYGSFNELLNAHKMLASTLGLQASTTTHSNAASTSQPPSLDSKHSTKPLSINTNNIGSDTDDIDEKLYGSIEIATSNAQIVFSELTKALSKTSIASAVSNSTNSGQSNNHTVATKVKELTNVCVSSMDITKRLKTKLITIRNNPSQTTKKLFWDDINLFLKAIIQTFSSVKGVMKDLPILNDVRSFMANLTKTTKDVTIMLEASSYRSMSSESASSSTSALPPQLPSIASVSNIFTPISPHPPMPNSVHSHSLANLVQMSNPILANTQQGLFATRTPLPNPSGPPTLTEPPSGHSNSMLNANSITGGASVTAPAHSTGQYYAKNGMNPFDGLILANSDKDRATTRTNE